MAYPRAHVRQALSMAREAGKPVEGLMAGDRETAIMLEKWGFLPINQDAVDERIAAWYVKNGLAARVGDAPDTPVDTPERVPEEPPERVPRVGADDAALAAAEAALQAAHAALRLARSLSEAS
jgi:hypothetical protein